MPKRGRPPVPLIAVCPDTGLTMTFASGREAGQLGFLPKAISRILRRGRGYVAHRGFEWSVSNGPVDAFAYAHEPTVIRWCGWIKSPDALQDAQAAMVCERATERLPALGAAGGLPNELIAILSSYFDHEQQHQDQTIGR